MEERNWIRNEAYIEMGKTVKYKVADIDRMVERIRNERVKYNLTPYVDIIPISADAHKTPNKMPTYQKDPITGVLYGIPNGEDDYGNIRWQRLQLNDTLALNLDSEMDCKIWAIIRFNPEILGSPFQKQNPYYKVFDPVATAKVEMDEVVSMKKAFEYVDKLKLSPKEMVFFARYLGEDLRENANKDIVEGILLKYARNYPNQFIQKFDSKSRSYGERFHAAKSLGIIEQFPDKGFTFRNLPLGFSEEEAIKMLSQDNAVMTAINNLIIEKDTVMRIVETEFNAEALRPEKSKSTKIEMKKNQAVDVSEEKEGTSEFD